MKTFLFNHRFCTFTSMKTILPLFLLATLAFSAPNLPYPRVNRSRVSSTTHLQKSIPLSLSDIRRVATSPLLSTRLYLWRDSVPEPYMAIPPSLVITMCFFVSATIMITKSSNPFDQHSMRISDVQYMYVTWKRGLFGQKEDNAYSPVANYLRDGVRVTVPSPNVTSPACAYISK